MANNEILNDICNQLGTSIENLLPKLIEYGKYDCQLTIYTWSMIFIFSMLILGAGLYIRKNENNLSSIKDLFSFVFVVGGFVFAFISICIIIIACYTLNEWDTFPEIMAYKYIISRI